MHGEARQKRAKKTKSQAEKTHGGQAVMSDEHGSFIMYTESWSGIQLLSREQRGDLLTALMAFNGADDCEMPEMDQATACVFAMLRSEWGNR